MSVVILVMKPIAGCGYWPQKTGLRSRVEIARSAGRRSAIRRMPARPGVRSVQGMKSLTLILAFLLLVVFSVLARFLPPGAAPASA